MRVRLVVSGRNSRGNILADHGLMMMLGTPENRGSVLEIVCRYLYHNQKHRNTFDAPDLDIPLPMTLQLMQVADYLESELVGSSIGGRRGSCGGCWVTFSVRSKC